MTREDFDNLTPEQIEKMKTTLKERFELSAQIDDINKSIESLKEQFKDINSKIDAFIDEYNNAPVERKIELLDEAEELKKQYEEIKNKIEELEKQKAEKEEKLEELNKLNEKTSVVNFIKDKIVRVNNKLIINKEKGFKTTKGSIKEWIKKDLKKGVIYKTASNIKSKMPEIKDAIVQKSVEVKDGVKEWAKQDIQNSVGYNVAETIKEKAPEIKEEISNNLTSAKFKINKSKDAIARAPKKAISGIKAVFNKISTKVGNVTKVVVAKTERFANIVKASVTDEIERQKNIAQIKMDTKSNLKELKRAAIEEQKRRIEEENAKHKIARSM